MNDISFQVHLLNDTIHAILHDTLNVRQVYLHMIANMLSPKQKEARVSMTRGLIKMRQA